MVGTPLPIPHLHVFISNKPSRKNSNLLEQVVEPLTIITGGHNHKDQLTYAWKMLLQNAPHDSICGCSIDEAHREMEVRFAKVNQVGNFVKTNLLNEWKGKLATQKPRVSTSLRSSTLAFIIRWTPSARLSMLRFVHLRNCIRQKASRKWLL